ncbi:hypothetical protein E4U55_001582 [Claviceps digitariae]|nr:hypothetical protein E4U55_001582 [Claviceps digitariae]
MSSVSHSPDVWHASAPNWSPGLLECLHHHPLERFSTRFDGHYLPLFVRVVYFSTSERLRIVRSQEYNELDSHAPDRLDSPHAPLSFDDDEGQQQPTLKLGFGQDELENAPHRRIQANRQSLRVYARPERRSVKRHLSSSDILSAQRGRQSVILDATEESMVRLGRRQSQTLLSSEFLPTCCTDSRPKMTKMVSFSSDNAATTSRSDLTAAPAATASTTTTATTTASTDAMFKSISWLEESKDLDLRLLLDDYRFDRGDEHVPNPTKRGPSFSRRRLSVSKISFGNRTCATVNGPASKDASARNSSAASLQTFVPGSPAQGHARRRSRALSLLTSSRQPVPAPDPSTFVDPAAAHYQDPDARMKLRVYLASAHKFDEAIEFGFPSKGDVQDKGHLRGHKRAVSQQERSNPALDKLLPVTHDDKSSIYSDEGDDGDDNDDDDDEDDDDGASTTEPDSPRTPLTVEKPLLMKATKGSRDEECHLSMEEYAQYGTTTSREMTLRMTLTRPDLRANEEQIYGWQKISSGRRKSSQVKDEPHLATSLLREGHSKESIERQFAALDQEGLLANDDGVMKRFWNRVRRA